MDMITLAIAKAYSDSKGGYTEKPVLTFNGKINPDAVVVEDVMVRISEKPYDINSVERITFNLNGESVVYDKSELIAQGAGTIAGIVEGFGNVTFIVSVTDELTDFWGMEKGTYFFCEEDENAYTEKVEFAETIHPIDPKFLPGVCLPVLELSQEAMAGVFASGNASCTAEEHAIIWGAYQALSPLIINGNYNGIAFSGVSNILLDSAYTPYFEANAGALKVMVAFDDKTANIRSVQQ